MYVCARPGLRQSALPPPLPHPRHPRCEPLQDDGSTLNLSELSNVGLGGSGRSSDYQTKRGTLLLVLNRAYNSMARHSCGVRADTERCWLTVS